MDRRFTNLLAQILFAPIAMGLGIASVHGASLRCTEDALAVNRASAPSMASVVSSASTHADEAAPKSAKTEKAERKVVTIQIVQTTTTTGGGGGSGGDDSVMGDGSTPTGVRKHGMRWQSFLPGVIK
jgi:hypothetical protein